jgi:hypothetical protein
MQCPMCGSRLVVTKTAKLSGGLVRRVRECNNPMCQYVDRTWEMLNDQKTYILLDEIFALLRDVAKTMGPGPVCDRLSRLHSELSRKN